jgi:ferredoxin
MAPTFRITLTCAQAPPAAFPCAADESIAGAALRAGFALALACERGGCGACRAELRAGAVSYLGPVSARRRQGDGGKLYELLCRAAPTTHTTLECVHPWRETRVGALSALLGAR